MQRLIRFGRFALLASAVAVAQPAFAQAARASGTVTVNRYLTYNAAAKTVALTLVAGQGSANGGMSFNGGFSGNQTITIPAGWTVSWQFTNQDAVPHSAVVLRDSMPLPAEPQGPAIPRAYTAHLTDGLPTNGTDATTFVAAPAGAYVIACGVPGHALSGMWIRLVVASGAAAPSYRM